MSTYDIDDLRRTFAEQADAAPDGLGLVAAAKTGAVRRRRARRAVMAAGAAAVVAGGAAVPALLDDGRATTAGPAAPPSVGSSAAAQTGGGLPGMTLALKPGVAGEGIALGFYGTKQYLAVSKAGPDKEMFDAAVYAPGTYDPATVTRGEKVTVDGHPAYYIPDFLSGMSNSSKGKTPEGGGNAVGSTPMMVKMPTVAWIDASGQLVTVQTPHDDDPKAHALKAASFVTLTPPTPVTGPVAVGYVPDTLSAQSYDQDSMFRLGFDKAGQPPHNELALPRSGASSWAMGISAVPAQGAAATADYGTPNETVQGAPAWHLPSTNPAEDTLVVRTPTCLVQFNSNPQVVPYDEVKRMAEKAVWKDCTNRDTWVKPLG